MVSQFCIGIQKQYKVRTDLSALLAALKECARVGNLERARAIHAEAIEAGHERNRYVAGSLVNMYAKCGSMVDAHKAFDAISRPDVVCWTALMTGYVENGQEGYALELLPLMQDKGCSPNAFTFIAALKACSALAAKEIAPLKELLDKGMAIHSQIKNSGCYTVMLANTLVDMYSKCGSLENAYAVFERMPCHGVVSWNAILLGCSSLGTGEQTLELYDRMLSRGCVPDYRTFVPVLKACSMVADKEDGRGVDGRLVKVKALEKGKAIHLQAASSGCQDHFVASRLIDLYGKCGSMVEAQRVFDRMPQHDAVAIKALLLGYAENGEDELVLRLFSSLGPLGGARAFVSPIKACTNMASKEEGKLVGGRVPKVEALSKGKAVHALATETGSDLDIFVACSLVNMYAKCGSMEDARRVFNRMTERNVVAWNSLLLGYVENGEAELALEAFARMESESCEASPPTYLAVLKACSSLAEKEERKQVARKLIKVNSLQRGAEIHARAQKAGCDSDTFVMNSLVDMYAKCGSLEDASRIFNRMKTHTTVSFNALMLAYAEDKQGDVTLRLFERMGEEGCQPTTISFIAAMKGCESLVALDICKTIQAEICRLGIETEPHMEACLVDVYGKCGSMVDAQQIFDAATSNNLITWTSLMVGYSRHGDSEEVFDLFRAMQEEGLQADSVTFVCMLTACSHAGLVDKARKTFNAMRMKHRIEPDVEHYTCMIDLLGRANQLEEAMRVVKTMHVKPNAVTWTTLLAACSRWKNVSVGTWAFEALIALDSKDAASYVLMANIYGSSGMFEEQSKVLALKKNAQAFLKAPEETWWTDHSGKLHSFVAGKAAAHPRIQEIDAKLKQIAEKIKEQGYGGDDVARCVIFNLTEPQGEEALCGHSERLAIGFALINTNPGSMIRIVKNSRLCDECHKASAIVSRIEQRAIIVKDANCFHVFRDGECSCKGIW